MGVSVLPINSQGINFIYENDTWSKMARQVKNLTQILLSFSIVLTHYLLLGNVDQRKVDLLGNDLGRGCLSSSWRSLKQNSLGSAAVLFNPRGFGDLIVDLRMSQVKQNSILDLPLLILVSSNVFPRHISKLIIPRLNHSHSELLKLLKSLINPGQNLLSFLLNLAINPIFLQIDSSSINRCYSSGNFVQF